LLIAQGEDLSTVAAQMRHADLSTTLRVYTHVMKHRRDGVAERLDEAIWGQNSGRNSVAKAAEPLVDANGSRSDSALPSGKWERARQDSNLRPLPPEGSALSTELRAPAGRV
jgi:hypothetical protein